MRPALSFTDLAGARVGVWGMRMEGVAVAERLEALGTDLVFVDNDPAIDPTREVVHPEHGGMDLLLGCDVVVKAPGVSRYGAEALRIADAGIPLVGGLGLWMQSADPSRVVAITGTKGKSTTASIVGHLLERLGHRVLVGGNIGRPPFAIDAPTAVDYWVIEVSSFQATDMAASPHVTAVTSLHADHLDWHGELSVYHRDKLSLTSQPGARITVAAGDDARLREQAGALGPEVAWVEHREAEWVHRLGVLGAHNVRNALIAQACVHALGLDASDERLLEAAEGFVGLPSRLRTIDRIGGVDFVDDSLATNVLPTQQALDAFPQRRVALIAGGHDRGIDYGELAEHLAQRHAPTAVFTLPRNGPRISAAIAASSRPVPSTDCDDLADAVAGAHAFAQPDGVVLLSPAAASFGQFRDYADRSAQFAAAVARQRPT